MVAYRPRVVDTELAERMESAGAVLLEGTAAVRRRHGVHVLPVAALGP